MAAIHSWLPLVWGIGAFLAGAFALFMVLYRKVAWGETAAMSGFLVWLFAIIVYAINGFYLVLFSVTIPNIFFWCVYYWRIAWYKRQKAAGLLVDAG
jgi:hypothetical protein